MAWRPAVTLQDVTASPDDFGRVAVTRSELEIETLESEDEDYESAPPDYKITTYPADFTLQVMYQMWVDKEFEIPEIQRGFIWKQRQSSKLIESFLMGLPVPPVFLYKDLETERYLVIDGQQRLRSIFYYFEGYFGEQQHGNRRVFQLTGLSPLSRFSNKAFEGLDEPDQRKLRTSVLRSFIVQQLEPNDRTSMYHIFERLNTGGTLLSNQEIRDCVYSGSLARFLREANLLPTWRNILAKPQSDARRKDAELILRFLAMRDRSAYRQPMKDFLSNFMSKNRNASEENLVGYSELLQDTCSAVLDALGPKPFHIRNGLNVAVADSVMVAFSYHLHDIPDDIATRYDRLKRDEAFDRSTRQATINEDTVRTRFERAEEVLFGAGGLQ